MWEVLQNSVICFVAIIGVLVTSTCRVEATSFIGKPCENNSTCQSFNRQSFCDEGRCMCNSDFIPNINKSRCLQQNVLIGESCEEHIQCPDFQLRRSICLPGSQRCACVTGYVPSASWSSCLTIINTLGSLGEECQENSQCLAGKPGRYSICNLTDTDHAKRCRCIGSATDAPFPNNNYCYDNVNIGYSCKVDAQCNQFGGICVEGVCQRP